MPKFTKEQQEAIDLEGCNILVSAGAGSGKTAVLSQRVLRKLQNKVSIDNLLVLTFTNAAAAEMKLRIRKKVGEDKTLVDEFEKIEASYITTFDSFTLAIVKKYHYLKNLSSNIEVCDASILTLKKEEILDTLINEMYEEKDKDFLDLIKSYCFKNDNDILTFIKNMQSEIDLLYNKKEYLESFVETYYSEDKINDILKKFNLLIFENINLVKTAYLDLELVDSEYTKKIDLSSLINSETYEEIFKNFSKKLPSLPKNSSEELKEAKEFLQSSLNELESLLKHETLLDYKNDYISLLPYTKTIIKIVSLYDNKITDFKTKENLYEFIDIEKLAIDILIENEEVREYYKNRFNEILIDEYQDTSDIQETFISQISKNNVYMVGDIKQSIYRFRNANPDIFRDKFNAYGLQNGGKRIDLNKNFRSREEVLTNINMLFDLLMDNYLGGADYQKEHRLIFGNDTYNKEGKTKHSNDFEVLTYEPLEDKSFTNDEIEIYTILRDIQNKVNNKYQIFDKDDLIKRNAMYSDFAILIDKSKNFDLIKKIFNYENVPLLIYKDESIKDSINIKIIKNLFILVDKVSERKYDNDFSYSYTSVARSYLFRLSDEQIIGTVKSKNYKEDIIISKINKIVNNIDDKNIYDILKELISEFNFYEQLITIGSIKDNEAVLEYLLSISKTSSSIYSVKEFINYLDQITEGSVDIKYSISKTGADSVKLMTIHGSKGLEYPIVYFPSLYQKFNKKDITSKYVINKNLGIIMPINNEKLFTKEILKREFLLEDISEKLRLFYVALTRAKEKFIFIMNFENKKDYKKENNVINNYDRLKYASFKDFLESTNSVITNYTKKIDISTLNLTKEYDIVKVYNYKDKLTKVDTKLNCLNHSYSSNVVTDKHFSKSTKELFTTQEKNYIKEGLNLHKIMEDIDFKNPCIDNVPNKYSHIITNFLKEDILKNAVNFFKEYEFIYEENNNMYHGIIDLLIEKENEYIIVDYKLSNTTSKEYISQLCGYKNYIESISNKKTSIYLYSLVKGELTSVESSNT